MADTRPTNTKRLERIDIRIPSEAKDLIRRAAETKGVTLSAFVISAAYDAAQETVLGVETMKLSPEQSARVIESLAGGPEPSAALVNLLGRCQTAAG